MTSFSSHLTLEDVHRECQSVNHPSLCEPPQSKGAVQSHFQGDACKPSKGAVCSCYQGPAHNPQKGLHMTPARRLHILYILSLQSPGFK